MKITLIFSFVLCCAIATAQEPVQLEVWTTVKSYGFDLIENPFGVGDRFAYLPNLLKGTLPHAFAISYREPNTDIQGFNKTYTWAFTKPDDTLNRYTWPFRFFPYATPDMNGDGQRDFFNGTKLYLGTKNDDPDTNTVYQYPGNSIGYAKFNADNCDDLYYYGTSPYLAHFRFGNPIAGKFQSVSIKSTYTEKDSQLEEYIKALYKNKQGQWRLLTLSKGWTDGLYERINQSKKSALRLYALEFTVINTDSTIVTATQIDEYKDPKWLEFEEDYDSKDPSIWSPFNSSKLLYQSDHYPKILYYASMNTMPDKDKKYDSYATFFDLTNDKIVPSYEKISSFLLLGSVLKHSVDGDKQEDIIRQDGDWTIKILSIDNNGFPVIKFIFQTESILPRGRMTHGFSVNDISGDGIADIACLFQNNSTGNAIAILKGQNITTSLEDKTYISEPYPIPSTTQLAIPLYIASPHHYTLHLFSQTGKEVKVLFDGDLSSGSHTLHCNISDFPSGTYILRLSDGTTLIDRLIIINH
jgi:hypothetical protein